jgi:hypothetical protein
VTLTYMSAHVGQWYPPLSIKTDHEGGLSANACGELGSSPQFSASPRSDQFLVPGVRLRVLAIMA